MVVVEIIAMLAFTIMAALWVLGIPISLIVIAIKISGIYRITLNNTLMSEKLIKEIQEPIEPSWNWNAVNKRAEVVRTEIKED
jgi:hypothetical protein